MFKLFACSRLPVFNRYAGEPQGCAEKTGPRASTDLRGARPSAVQHRSGFDPAVYRRRDGVGDGHLAHTANGVPEHASVVVLPPHRRRTLGRSPRLRPCQACASKHSGRRPTHTVSVPPVVSYDTDRRAGAAPRRRPDRLLLPYAAPSTRPCPPPVPSACGLTARTHGMRSERSARGWALEDHAAAQLAHGPVAHRAHRPEVRPDTPLTPCLTLANPLTDLASAFCTRAQGAGGHFAQVCSVRAAHVPGPRLLWPSHLCRRHPARKRSVCATALARRPGPPGLIRSLCVMCGMTDFSQEDVAAVDRGGAEPPRKVQTARKTTGGPA